MAEFGQGLLQVSSAIRDDRAARERQRLNVDLQGAFNDLRLEADNIGNPDELRSFWTQGSAEIRERFAGAISPDNTDAFDLLYADLNNSHSFQIGRQVNSTRQSQWRANFDDFSFEAARTASLADTGTAQRIISDGIDQLAQMEAAGIITPEERQRRERSFRQEVFGARATRALDDDPRAVLADVEAGRFRDLGAEGEARLRSQALTGVEALTREEQRRQEELARERAAELDTRLSDFISVTNDHRVSADPAILAEPGAAERPRYNEARAAQSLQQDIPNIGALTSAELSEVIVVERNREITEPWEGQRMTVLQRLLGEAQTRERERQTQIGSTLTEIRGIAEAGRSPDNTAVLADPEFQAHPDYARTQATVALSGAIDSINRLPPARAAEVVERTRSGYVDQAWKAEADAALEDAARQAAMAWREDPVGRAVELGMAQPLPEFDEDPEAFATALAQRTQLGQRLVEDGYIREPASFSIEERDAIQDLVSVERTPQERVRVAQMLAQTLDPAGRDALDAVVTDPVFTYVADAMQGRVIRAPLAEEIFRGQQALEAGNVILPPRRETLPEGIAGLRDVFAGLPDGEALTASVLATADALYASKARPTGAALTDDTASIYREALQQALGATGTGRNRRGGVQEVNDAAVLLPPQERARDVEDMLDSLGYFSDPSQSGRMVMRDGLLLDQLARASNTGKPPVGLGPQSTGADLQDFRLLAVGPEQYTFIRETAAGTRQLMDTDGQPFIFSLGALAYRMNQ